MKIPCQLMASLFCLCLAVSIARADPIVNLDGDLILIPRPSIMDFAGNLFSGFTNLRPVIFNEHTDQAVPTFSQTPLSRFTGPLASLSPSDFIGLDFLTLNITTPGTYPPQTENPGQLTSQTRVTTFIIHYEPSDTNPTGSTSGSVTFNTNIIGIQTSSFNYQFARELIFGQPGISLLGSSGVEDGFGDPTTSDVITVTSDMRTIFFTFNVNGATDDMRVFLTPENIPEPATSLVFASGLWCLTALSRRRKGWKGGI